MRKIFLILFPVLFGFQSCQLFEPKLPSKEELLKKELQSINWDEVDEFPTVDECEKIEDKKLRQQCFFEFFAKAVQSKVNAEALKKKFPKMDTLEICVTVFPNSTLKFEAQRPNDPKKYDPIMVDSLLQLQLTELPKVHPAIKRGIPVKTQFVLPIILKSE